MGVAISLITIGSVIRGGHPDPEIRGVPGPVSKKFYLDLRASVWSKNKGGPWHPGPLSGSATEGCCTLATKSYPFEDKCARNLYKQTALTTSSFLASTSIAN